MLSTNSEATNLYGMFKPDKINGTHVGRTQRRMKQMRVLRTEGKEWNDRVNTKY